MSSALLQCSKLNVLLLQRSQRINRPALHRSRGCQIVGRAAGQSLDLPDEDIYSDYDEPEYVDPNAEEDDGGWQQMMYEEFNPVIVPPDDLFLLDFEKPLAVNERKVRELRQQAEAAGVNVEDIPQIGMVEKRNAVMRKYVYSTLNPLQQLQVSRHPNRPTFLEVVYAITDGPYGDFIELHGDRGGKDDPAIVCGLGVVNGETFMFIGQQKGRDTRENVLRSFGMPHPQGYRKALRFMRYADKFGFPIITFIDTPGAFAGVKAEEDGQGEAIAVCLREMFALRVPVFSVVLGEGGSGGALAIGVSNRAFIMENAVYYVASPEACAAILWSSRAKVGAATKALRITSKDLYELGIMDEIIPEPIGAMHHDPETAYASIKNSLWNSWERYRRMSCDEIMADRYDKFRHIGEFTEFDQTGAEVEEGFELRNMAFEEGLGVYTKAGTWAIDEIEAAEIEEDVDEDEEFDQYLQDHADWTKPPLQPPGINDGMFNMMLRKASVMSNQDDAGTVTAGGYQAVPPSVLPGQGFLDSSNAGFDGFSPAAEPMFVAPDGPYIDVEATEGANPDASSRSAVLKQLTAALTAAAAEESTKDISRAVAEVLGKEEARSLVGTQGQTRPLLGGVSPLSPAVREKFTSLAASITEIVRQNPPGEQSEADMEKVDEEIERIAAETGESEEVRQFMWNVRTQIYQRMAAGQEFPEATQATSVEQAAMDKLAALEEYEQSIDESSSSSEEHLEELKQRGLTFSNAELRAIVRRKVEQKMEELDEEQIHPRIMQPAVDEAWARSHAFYERPAEAVLADLLTIAQAQQHAIAAPEDPDVQGLFQVLRVALANKAARVQNSEEEDEE
mmetsp:Transcript_9605/g.28919  ORF Transcript_9605/g.28919 Transcript_9605/m.28919 type:complete len:847 (-) Transcript_9605:589-3129(-)